MKALTLATYGDFDQLALRDIPLPQPGPGEVLVRIRAAAVNPFDNKLRSGLMRDAMPLTFPYTPGFDGAGTVERVGDGTTAFRPGDPVVGLFPIPGNGTLAEYAVHHGTGPGPLVAIPDGVSFAQAAALPETGLTALPALDAAHVSSRNTLLLIGATGGIGLYLTQLAARRGVHVIATARPEDAAYIRELEAAETIDYTMTDPIPATRERYPAGVDAVVDLINQGEALYHSAEAARDGGTLVSVLSGPEPASFPRPAVAVHYVQLDGRPDGLTALLRDAAAGALRIEIGRTFPLDRGADALRALEEEHTRGKIVVTVA